VFVLFARYDEVVGLYAIRPVLSRIPVSLDVNKC